jgi:hypothetical protein
MNEATITSICDIGCLPWRHLPGGSGASREIHRWEQGELEVVVEVRGRTGTGAQARET